MGHDRDGILAECKKYFENKLSPTAFIPGQTFIPPSGKVLDSADGLHLIDAALDMWLTAGRYAEEFETKVAKKFGRKLSKLTVSGSAANLLAFASLTSWKLGDKRLKPGDEVITVAAGFPTTVAQIFKSAAVLRNLIHPLYRKRRG